MSLDELNEIGWRDFIVWAWANAEMREQFTAKTGVEIQTVTAPINDAVDLAWLAKKGPHKSPAMSFIEWATREYWGLEYAPRAYRQKLEAQS